MDDYESKYEEYKNNLLHEKWFRNELTDLYRGSLNVEEDYIRENGVLWKVGALSFACGLCFSLFSISGDDARIIITRIVLFIILVAIFILAMHIGKKFAKKSGERKFYAFEYDKYFKDRVQTDKDMETKVLLRDALSHYDSIKWRADSIQNMSEEDVKSLFISHIKKMDDFQKRYEEISRYDRFAGSLKNDYWFNAEIQKDIDKYI